MPYDLTADTLHCLARVAPEPGLREKAEEALTQPARRCRVGLGVHRLRLTAEQRERLLSGLRRRLAGEGYEEGGAMRPFGHVLEGLIETFSRPSRMMA